MKLVIISGRSGSGKSSALHLLEDEGYYCIDNLPVALIPELVNRFHDTSTQSTSNVNELDKIALCIDARNTSSDLKDFVNLLELRPDGVNVDIIFLDTDTNKLIKRFSETRRRHPLSNKETALAEAIEREKIILEPIADKATLTIDTTEMSLHELRSTLKARLVEKQGPGISVLFQSFGFKHGIPQDADIVYDIRILPNPHWDHSLRSLTGLDQPVIDFLDHQPEVESMFNDIKLYLEKWLPSFESNNRSYITIAIGCTGGQHRSVYMAERLAHYFLHDYKNVQVRHRENPGQ
jgi:UPF0042 nucleotide-binding protein